MSEQQEKYKKTQKMTSDQAFKEYVQMTEEELDILHIGEGSKEKREKINNIRRAFKMLKGIVDLQNEKIEQIKGLVE